MNKNQDKRMVPTKEVVEQYVMLFGETSSSVSDEANGKILEMEEMYDFGCHAFVENGKVGLKDCLGGVLVLPEYEEVEEGSVYVFRDSPVIVKDGGRYGVVTADGTNSQVVPCDYEKVVSYASHWIVTGDNGKYGVYSLQGEKLLDTVADKVWLMTTGLAYERDGKTGLELYNDRKWIMTDAIFDMVYEPSEGDILEVVAEGKPGWVTIDGQFISEERYESDDRKTKDEYVFVYG